MFSEKSIAATYNSNINVNLFIYNTKKGENCGVKEKIKYPL